VFTPGDDGETRCEPAYQGSGSYSDDEYCQDPIAPVGGRGCTPAPARYVTRWDPNATCATGARYFEAGDAVPTGTQIYLGGSACLSSGTIESDQSFVRYGAAIPAVRFERLERVWAGTGRLREERHRNPEGFTVAASADHWPGDSYPAYVERWIDTERKEYCAFATTEDGTQRCVPDAFEYATASGATSVLVQDIFADSTCSSTPLANHLRWRCWPERRVDDRSNGGEKQRAVE